LPQWLNNVTESAQGGTPPAAPPPPPASDGTQPAQQQ